MCIVTDPPIRLQGKKQKSARREPGTQLVRVGDVVLAIRLSATGELIVEVEPP